MHHFNMFLSAQSQFSLRILAFLFVALWMGAQPSFAQETSEAIELPEQTLSVLVPTTTFHTTAKEPDYETWARTARRAEEAVTSARASEQAFENLRKEIELWRDEFGKARSLVSAPVRDIEALIAELGPVPEPPAVEPFAIQQRRAEMQEQLAVLRAPILRAEEAYRRANSLIGAVDRILREREAAALWSLGPSPVNPARWPSAFSHIMQAYHSVKADFSREVNSDFFSSELKKNIVPVVVLLLIGLVLCLRGHSWGLRLSGLLARAVRKPAAKNAVGAVLSIAPFVLQFIGVLAITAALFVAGLVGIRGELFVGAIPAIFALALVGKWLADEALQHRHGRAVIFDVPAPVAERFGRYFAPIGGALIGLYGVLSDFSEIEGFEPATSAVLLFPVLVGGAFLLWRIARVLMSHQLDSDCESGAFWDRIVRNFGRVLLFVAVVGVALAALGMGYAAERLVFSSLGTVALVTFGAILQRLIADIYDTFVRPTDAPVHGQALIPVLGGFIITGLSLPLLALVWGVRSTDLGEMWAQFVKGVSIGDTTISPKAFMVFAVIFTIGYLATRMLQGALRSSVLPKTRLDPGGQAAVVSGIGYVGFFLAAIVAITAAGFDLSSIAIVAGALSVGIGFGLQNIVSNFVSGIILLIERPVSPGDWIEVGAVQGYVREISVRSTRIETFDRADVIVPNADLVSGVVTNMTHGKLTGRVIVPVGVAYGSDSRVVERVLREIAEAHPMVLADPAPYVVFQGFGADSMDFEIRAILRDVNWVLSTKSDMNHDIARRFAEEGIEIPFAQRDIWIKNPEAIPNGAKD
ncbi:MAG: DUF3772 domain-containing protein [Halocynthiibacter sp.]